MSRLYTYVMQNDTGLAPNPFWGFCTLAVCTPNHQGSRISEGDWVAGFQNKAHGYKLVYAMEVSECIHMDSYFRDHRFASKKPNLSGNWMERCGDNFYSQSSPNSWTQHPNQYHCTSGDLAKDTKHPKVFVGTRFWYLGAKAAVLPTDLRPLAGGRGARVNHPELLVQQFKSWVQRELRPGVSGNPRDLVRRGTCGA